MRLPRRQPGYRPTGRSPRRSRDALPACGDACRRGEQDKMVKRTCRRAALLLALVSSLVHAQPAPEDDAVVVTASRTQQRLRDAIPHTTVLTQKDFRDSQAIDLLSLLRS